MTTPTIPRWHDWHHRSEDLSVSFKLGLNKRQLINLSRAALGRGNTDKDPTPTEIARMLGVNSSTTSRLFNDEAKPGTAFMAAAIDYFTTKFGWSPGDVFVQLFADMEPELERKAS